MSCVSRIATARAWLEARLGERGYDPARTEEILGDSTFVSAGATIYVDFREPPGPRALTFEFSGGAIRGVLGLDDDDPHAAELPAPGEPRSRASV
jgi:hypothetical protein